MPSLITHTYFSIDVFEKLNKKLQNKFLKDIKTYNLFSNGPDPYFSYCGINQKKYRKFGHTMHIEKTGEFFLNTINYIKENNLKNNSQVLAYLYGNITHYILDSTIHPLVYYQTGRFIKGKKDRKKYKGKHATMELTIDQYMITTRNIIKPNKFKIHEFGIPKIELSKELKELINYSNIKTYNINNTDKILNKSIKTMRRIYKYLRYDKYGIKKIIYNILNKITFNKIPLLTTASYKFEYNKYIDYLNLDKNEWFHPVDKEEKFNYSFIELYCIAIKKAVDLIEEIDKVLDNKQKINKIYDLLNNSYLTGKNIEDTRKIKYFSY